MAAIGAQLRKKGLTPVDAAGDLEVHFLAGVARGYDVVSHGYGPRWGAGRGNAQVRAVASDELDPQISPADRESRLAAVAEKMFHDFPPGHDLLGRWPGAGA